MLHDETKKNFAEKLNKGMRATGIFFSVLIGLIFLAVVFAIAIAT